MRYLYILLMALIVVCFGCGERKSIKDGGGDTGEVKDINVLPIVTTGGDTPIIIYDTTIVCDTIITSNTIFWE